MKSHRVRGSALLVVLMVMGFFSLLSVLFVQYAQWQSNLKGVPRRTLAGDEALRFARDRVHQTLKKNLSDTGVLPSPTEKNWQLKPSLVIKARLVSLNSKLNLNTLLSDTHVRESRFVGTMLDELGYPPRAYDELRDWVDPNPEGPDATYAGLGYHAPGRKIQHLDEVELVSGFIQPGVSTRFRQLFTVYGTGTFNPLHLTPEEWRVLRKTGGLDLPALPDEARSDPSTFREFLRREEVWNSLEGRYPFLTRRDDSFRVDYTIKAGSVTRHVRSIYEYRHLTNTLIIETRYPWFKFNQNKEDLAGMIGR